MPFLKVNHANFYYELHGVAQPLILIAGYACDHLTWLPVLDALTKHFQVLIFDNRAVGETTDDNAVLTAKLMAEDVMALADRLNLVRPHIIGHSLGGNVAQMVASLYPEKIGKLCLLNSSAKWRAAMLLGLKSIFEMREKNLEIDFIVDAIIPWLFGTDFLASLKNVNAFKQAILSNPYPQSLEDQRRQVAMIENFDGVAALKNIQAQTLVGYGAEDIISLPMDAEFLVKNIRHAELVKFDCAHGVMFERPKELVKVLLEFLKSDDK